MKIFIDFIKSKQKIKFEDIFIPIVSYPIFYIFYYNFISVNISTRKVSNYAATFFILILVVVRFIRFKRTYKKE